MDAATTNTVTIPLDASVAYPLYTTIWLSQVDVGLTSVDVIPGVTLESSSGSFDSPGQNTIMMLYKWDTNSWKLYNGTVILPIDLTTDVAGVLPVANGGTGRNNNPADEILYGDGTSPIQSSSNFTFDGTAVTIGSPTDNIKIDQATGIISRAGTSKILQLVNPDGGVVTLNENVTIQGGGVSITSIASAFELISAADVLITPQTYTSIGGTSSHSAEFRLYEQTTSGSNYTAFKVAAQGSDITYTLPSSAPASNGYVLSSTTAGGLSWISAGGGGSVTSIATTSPITGGTITTTGTIGINNAAADGSTLGAASFSASYFNSSSGNITPDLTNGLSSASQGGYLSSTDWSTFNSKASTVYVDNKIEDAINDGEITKAPTENIVYDALLLKVDKASNLTDLASGPTALKNIGGIERAAVANTQSGSYTLAASDFTANTIVYLTGSGQTVTVPNNSTIPITAGVYVYFWRTGANAALFSPAAGVTITSTSGANLDPGQYQLCALIKEPGTTNNWLLFNGGTPLGAANQLLGVNSAATIQEYKTVSNGLTSATGTLKLGGALTADTQFPGAFSLGIGAAPTAKLSVTGLGTTTGPLGLFEDNAGTDRLLIADNGAITHAATLSGTGTVGITSTITTSSTANSQTLAGYNFIVTPTYGANTGVTMNTFRISATTAAADYYKISQGSSGTSSSQIWDATGTYDFRNSSSTSILRNSVAALSLRGGTSSTSRMLQFTTTVASSTNNNAAFNFTGNTHDYGSAVTRTNTEILNDATITSVNGSTLTYNIFDNSPGFTIGTSTATVTGYNYNPTFTSGTFTHYAMRVQSGLSAFGHTNTPTAFMDLAASTTASASLRIRSGSAPTSPNDGEVWQDGTNYLVRGGSTTYTLAKTLTATATLNFPAAGASSSTDLTITVTGAADGDPVVVTPPNGSIVSNGVFTAWVSAANTVTVRFSNLNLVTDPDPASGTFRATVLKY